MPLANLMSVLPPAALARHVESVERRRALARALHQPPRLAEQLAKLDAQLAELRRKLLDVQRLMRAALPNPHPG